MSRKQHHGVVHQHDAKVTLLIITPAWACKTRKQTLSNITLYMNKLQTDEHVVAVLNSLICNRERDHCITGFCGMTDLWSGGMITYNLLIVGPYALS